MAELTTTTGFTRTALEAALERDGSPASVALRRPAFEAFEAMPTPSPDTEEWRYTDLRGLDLSFDPFVPEPPADSLDHVAPGLLEAAGEIGGRSGLAVQHNSTVVTGDLDPAAAAQGVVFTSLERAT